MTIVESTKELEDMRTFHLPQFSMRGKIITFSAVTLSIAALGTVAYQSVSQNSNELGASLCFWCGSSSTSSATSGNFNTSSSVCGGVNGACGGSCGNPNDVCLWQEQANNCVCQPSSAGCGGNPGMCSGNCPNSDDVCTTTERGWCGCRTPSSSSITSSACSVNSGGIRPNCPASGEMRGTCNPSTCESDHFNGMCLAGGLCASTKGPCADNTQCSEQFQYCGSPGARECTGYCADSNEECRNLGTDSRGNIICGCRSDFESSGFSSSY